VLTFASAHALVHWAGSGSQKPPAADANRNGLPDYVERVAAAVEKARAFYVAAGFPAPASDGSGLIDIYLVKTGDFDGLTVPDEASGPFVLLSTEIGTSAASGYLERDVAHELFHLVQYGLDRLDAPSWVLEGSAEYMSSLVYPYEPQTATAESVWAELYEQPRSLNDSPYAASGFFAFLGSLDLLKAILAPQQQSLDVPLTAFGKGALAAAWDHYARAVAISRWVPATALLPARTLSLTLPALSFQKLSLHLGACAQTITLTIIPNSSGSALDRATLDLNGRMLELPHQADGSMNLSVHLTARQATGALLVASQAGEGDAPTSFEVSLASVHPASQPQANTQAPLTDAQTAARARARQE
jgi:hypothetical protein